MGLLQSRSRTNNRYIRRWPLLASLVLMIGCTQPQVSQAPEFAPALIVFPGATNVKRTDENAGVVVYDLNEPYPAPNTIAALRTKLEKEMDWKPLTEDVLNPGLRLSFSRGWSEFASSIPGPEYVYQWFAQWEDASGRVAWYILSYDGTEISKGNFHPEGHLRVRATILSAEEVRRIRGIADGGKTR